MSKLMITRQNIFAISPKPITKHIIKEVKALIQKKFVDAILENIFIAYTSSRCVKCVPVSGDSNDLAEFLIAWHTFDTLYSSLGKPGTFRLVSLRFIQFK
ncbi:hypothetical protein BpHYR1_036227 [Brachionus plicatilis]|uniref:Uncharacterized protein n=1 Tax=Brachionus plicatilis TaxID=10195 RepID=A0A3M7S4B0_BRAPC|nr:hypothetical protein BpHYR1_036227 [Brachionus plicatilis]